MSDEKHDTMKKEEKMEATHSSSSSDSAVQKKDKTTKTVLIVLGVIVVICLCCSVLCVLTGLGTSLLTSLGINQANAVIESAKKAYSFDVKVKSVSVTENDYVLTLEVKNTGTTKTSFSSLLNMTLKDGTGKEYYEDFSYSVPSSQSLDGDIAPGETKTGKVAYLVNGNPSSLTLTIFDSIFDNNGQEVKIK